MGRVAGLTAAETRERVTQAAAEVFAECGYEGARVSQIARRAGLSTGAIYSHYRSKAELLGAVVDLYATSELAELFIDQTAPDAGILDLIARKGGLLQARPQAASLLAEAILAARRDAELAAELVDHVKARESLFAELVRLAQSSGEADTNVDSDVVARFCLMLGLGSLLVGAMELQPARQPAWEAFIARLIDGFRSENQDKDKDKEKA